MYGYILNERDPWISDEMLSVDQKPLLYYCIDDLLQRTLSYSDSFAFNSIQVKEIENG